MSTPGKILARTIPVSQQVGKQSFYLTEIGQLAPNKLKYVSPSSRAYGGRGEKEKKRDLDFAHLGHAMIFNYPMEGVFY